MNQTFVHRSRFEVPAAALFDWHARPGALQRLTPPWESVEVIEPAAGITDGSRGVMRVQVGPVRRRWVAEHRNYVAGQRFQDVQVEGPFAFWEHTHTIIPDGPDASILEDRIEYRLPLRTVGRLLGDGLARGKLERMFAYRHRITADDLRAHERHREAGTMRILISGPTGLVGSALSAFLTTGGHEAVGLTRRANPGSGAVQWDPTAGRINAAELEGFDAVIHLAGENIAAGRWTAKRKARIRDSRVVGTRLLSETLARLQRPPKVLVCASATGYYGDRGEERLTEESPPGTGFLADVCREWEEAARPARDAGIRIVNLRIGIVLSARGGALPKMLTPFKLGAGGRIGSGRQYWSWIALDDVVGAIHHALMSETLHGPANAVVPEPATNAEFTKALGGVLHRPTVFPLPAPVARLALGREMSNELLLASTRVVPEQLQQTGYAFRHPDLREALRHELGR